MSESMAYAGFCQSCGHLVSATVDDPDHAKDVRKDVSQFMRDGLRIERVSCQTVRENAKPCAPDCSCKFCQKRSSSTRTRAR